VRVKSVDQISDEDVKSVLEARNQDRMEYEDECMWK
jgi:hypothetical protein